MKLRIIRIRSGGQSGVDRAALDFARCKILRSAAGVPKADGRRIIPRRPVLRRCIWTLVPDTIKNP